MFADRYQLVSAYIIRKCQSASVKVVSMKSGKIGLVNYTQNFKKSVKNPRKKQGNFDSKYIKKTPNAIGNRVRYSQYLGLSLLEKFTVFEITIDLQGLKIGSNIAVFKFPKSVGMSLGLLNHKFPLKCLDSPNYIRI